MNPDIRDWYICYFYNIYNWPVMKNLLGPDFIYMTKWWVLNGY